MRYLKTITDANIFPNDGLEIPSEWENRKTVKVVLVNDEGRVAFVTNSIHKQILLPGGGIDDGENVLTAANRECDEEVNWTIRDAVEIGCIEEFRARDGKHYESFAVFARTDKENPEDTRTEEEKQKGLEVVWLSPDEARTILQQQEERLMKEGTKFYNTGFNIVRDRFFFNLAQEKGFI